MRNTSAVDKCEVRRELLGFDECARRHARFLDRRFLDRRFLDRRFLDRRFLDNSFFAHSFFDHLLYTETPTPTTLRR